MFLKSRLLAGAGFVHGFSTRRGGCSPAPFDSLDCGASAARDPAGVEENLRRLAEAAGIERAAFRGVVQVHGARVHRATAERGAQVEADAVYAAAPGLAPAVKTADCVPILLADEASGLAAAVHAGWRGTDAAIAARAVEALVAAGARIDALAAAIGPAIGRCCYEVSPELAARFHAGHPGAVEGRRLDLQAINRALLEGAGLLAERIEVLAHCTACEPHLFFSHRRDAGRTGRHLSFVVARGARSLS